MKKKYYKRNGFVLKTNAETVGKEIDRLRKKYKNDSLDPKILLEEARDEKNPIHNEFIWDDKKAAEKYRLTRAQYLIRAVEVEIIPYKRKNYNINVEIVQDSEPIGIGVFTNKGRCEYPSVKTIKEDEIKLQKTKIKVEKEFFSMYNKYIRYQGLFGKSFDEVLKAIEKLQKETNKKKGKK